MVETRLILHEDLLALRFFQDVPATGFTVLLQERPVLIGCCQMILTIFRRYHSFRIESSSIDFLARPCCPDPQCMLP